MNPVAAKLTTKKGFTVIIFSNAINPFPQENLYIRIPGNKNIKFKILFNEIQSIIRI